MPAHACVYRSADGEGGGSTKKSKKGKKVGSKRKTRGSGQGGAGKGMKSFTRLLEDVSGGGQQQDRGRGGGREGRRAKGRAGARAGSGTQKSIMGVSGWIRWWPVCRAG